MVFRFQESNQLLEVVSERMGHVDFEYLLVSIDCCYENHIIVTLQDSHKGSRLESRHLDIVNKMMEVVHIFSNMFNVYSITE